MPTHRDGWLISDAYAVPNMPQLIRLARAYHRALSGDMPLPGRWRAHLAAQVNRLIAVSDPLSEAEAINLLYTAWPQCAAEVCP